MLLTKLHIPSNGKDLVHRTSLFDKLNHGLNRKLILISAPAGFGKTTLVSDWIFREKIPASWFSLDKGDNDPIEFLNYIILGIQNIDNKVGQNALSLLESTTKPSAESILGLLINDILKINQNFLLVLDDFHLVESNEIIELVSYFLDYIPENIHLAILTRSDPNLPLSRLRSQQQMIELRSSELNFSVNDISDLFNKKLRLKLSVEDISSLETKTEGWIAGLQLAALSLQGQNDTSGFIQKFKGDNRYIMDYLIEEVLKVQSEDIKDFLLKTSILKQLSAPLCNALLTRSDSQFILEKLERNNMFVVPLDSERHWYRYHHLFVDLLKQRLMLKHRTLLIELHNRACNWFEKNKMFKLAIHHALEVNNFEKGIQLLSKIVEEMWENGQHLAITKYGDLIPDNIIKMSPEFCLYYSWILVGAGQTQRAEILLSTAEKAVKNRIKDENSQTQTNKLLGKIAVAFAYLNSHKQHAETSFSYCEIAMENLSEDDPLWFSWAWFSYGIAHFSLGEFFKSKDAYNKAFDYGKKSGNIYLMSTIVIRLAENEQLLGNYSSAYKRCSHLLGIITDKGFIQITKTEWTYAALYFTMGITQFMKGELEKAYEYMKFAYDLCENEQDVYLKTSLLFGYSIVLKELGRTEAEKKNEELENLVRNNVIPPYLHSMFVGWKIFLLMDKNEIEAASEAVLEYGLGLDNEKTHENEAAYMAYVRLLLKQYRLDEAEKLLDELYTMAAAEQRVEREIDHKITYAALFEKKGEREKAIKNLMEAMELAADESLMLYFLLYQDEIDVLFTEIFTIHATTQTRIPKEFIDGLRTKLKKRKSHKKNQLESELSTRELDTLKLVAENLSNKEIADKLFISLNTVKTHLKNINLKLEVQSRNKAAAKAKELGLI